jgi:hypothetical protein
MAMIDLSSNKSISLISRSINGEYSVIDEPNLKWYIPKESIEIKFDLDQRLKSQRLASEIEWERRVAILFFGDSRIEIGRVGIRWAKKLVPDLATKAFHIFHIGFEDRFFYTYLKTQGSENVKFNSTRSGGVLQIFDFNAENRQEIITFVTKKKERKAITIQNVYGRLRNIILEEGLASNYICGWYIDSFQAL